MSEQQAVDSNEQILLRKSKLQQLRLQTNAFPNDFVQTDHAALLHAEHNAKTNEELEQAAITVNVAGRIMLRRLMGKASFVQMQDSSVQLQLYLKESDLTTYEDFKTWDLGDIIGATGVLFKTKTGELSVRVTALRLLTKALRPLPDKWHGLQDQELRYRQRYVDLMVNASTREIFLKRSKIIQLVRSFLNARNFLEVETPMMQPIPGGAAARPFVTYHNTLAQELYLRIAPELYLKRLVVGGFERVYEINRNFRNEGVSTRHNPEFTMLEFYQAYATYKDLMVFTEELLRYLAEQLTGSSVISYQGYAYDFSKPFAKMSVRQSLLHFNSDLTDAIMQDKVELSQYIQRKNYDLNLEASLTKLQFDLFELTVEHQLIQPTFITEYPTEVSPLARCNDNDPTITDRFEFFIAGRELANGFSELNDPEDQAERFRQQVLQKEAGDKEAMHYDDDYVQALEYGLPPTAGEGIGIDRLVMLFTDAPSIREVILFPHLRSVASKA